MASGAKLSANAAALRAAHVCHQVFGANGITLEGPVFHVSRRIRQLASQSRSDRSEREVLLGSYWNGKLVQRQRLIGVAVQRPHERSATS